MARWRSDPRAYLLVVMKRILVGVDGSEGAARAARWAAELAHRIDATLELVHVYDAPEAVQLGLRGPAEREPKSEGARRALAAAEEAIGGLMPVERYFAAGRPASEIVARAEETEADLVVLGSLGVRSLEGVMLGSVAKVVIERAARPVTVVP